MKHDAREAGTRDAIVRTVRSTITALEGENIDCVECNAVATRARAALESGHESLCARSLLATPAGVVTLSTGRLREARPADLITRITSVAPDFEAGCPRWMEFLLTCTQGDTALVAWLQRVCGYFLTGSTKYELVFMLYGSGGNGKTCFLRALRDILGDYYCAAPVHIFLASYHDQHPAGVAMLNGARLVACTELPEGREWNSTRIKDIASGERIAARFMHQNFFTFEPVCKLCFCGNHKPRLRAVDEAERRRFRLIPFTHRVPEAERDPELSAKLRVEYPAILAWMVEGARQLWSSGLGEMPSAVREASADYFNESDSFTQWVDEALEFDSAFSTQSSILYRAYADWFTRNSIDGHRIGTTDFKARLLGEHSLRFETLNRGNFFRGVRLRSEN
ncbi:phage/plasmid primase, P4 family [Caballeronia sp. LZ019]|uniref:phage/plasmid primase, P4 family n=1 Tax=Caballeronia sp. LZ019 TaxID=3038555 RepID=UPI0028597236|nr:phage/plasmid primase, P4 family [Caballeronia sp. LZ019]MDR5807667.1 phage/plasmid primase, P4 family [Caballeronia sp. LZ019]